jgi:hypothetical protein
MNGQDKLEAVVQHIAATEIRQNAEIAALRCAVAALMQASPQPEKVLQAFSAMSEQSLAVLLGSGVRDAHFEARQQASGRVLQLLEDAASRHRSQGR